jgi:uncharacterized membrane protein
MESQDKRRVDRQTDSSGTRPFESQLLTPHSSPTAGLVSGAVTTLTLTLSFVLLAVGFEYFWVTYIVGFGFVLPAATSAVSYRETATERTQETTRDDTTGTALEDLRHRYATGELTDEEFEQNVERLVETERNSGQ